MRHLNALASNIIKTNIFKLLQLCSFYFTAFTITDILNDAVIITVTCLKYQRVLCHVKTGPQRFAVIQLIYIWTASPLHHTHDPSTLDGRTFNRTPFAQHKTAKVMKAILFPNPNTKFPVFLVSYYNITNSLYKASIMGKETTESTRILIDFP